MSRVAVLMSSYNGEKYIKEQIESVLSQDCIFNIDLIVRDDGSTDNTINILKSFGDRIKWYSGENLGAGLSFLKLIYDNPGYDYYAFSDQDDFWEKCKIQIALEHIKDVKKCALYCSNALICDSDLNSLGRYVHRKMNYFNIERALLGLCCAQGCTIVFNSKLADVICSLDFALQKVTLHDLFLTRLIFMIDGFFYADNSSYLKYRMHEDNIGGLKTAKQISKVAMIKKRFKYMIEKKDISIIEQLVNIRDCYNKYINNRNSSIINNIIKCKSNFYYRLLFALKPSLRDESFNLSITNRIKIILGNF